MGEIVKVREETLEEETLKCRFVNTMTRPALGFWDWDFGLNLIISEFSDGNIQVRTRTKYDPLLYLKLSNPLLCLSDGHGTYFEFGYPLDGLEGSKYSKHSEGFDGIEILTSSFIRTAGSETKIKNQQSLNSCSRYTFRIKDGS